jgi:hypothetical protein
MVRHLDRFLAVVAFVTALSACAGQTAVNSVFEIPSGWIDREVWLPADRDRLHVPDLVIPVPPPGYVSPYPSGVAFDGFQVFAGSEDKPTDECEESIGENLSWGTNTLTEIELKCPEPFAHYKLLYMLTVNDLVFYARPNSNADNEKMHLIRLSLLNAYIHP